MASRHVLLIQGHPDPAGGHFGHALAEACAEGAIAAGHSVRRVEIAQLEFPLLRSQAEWAQGSLPPALKPAQDAIGWAEHLVIFFPLWMGDMPALLKAFFEQVLRPGFAFDAAQKGALGQKKLGGRTARLVVTMGMPALAYRCYFRAHSVKALERNVLGFVGIAPVRETLIGGVEALDEEARIRWCAKLGRLGARAD
jgi:putative NADPH-quinone reductase